MSTPGELLEALGREARARFGNSGEAATRVYRGRSVEELVPQIQRDLGAEAIIVRRREGLTGGMLGFFQHAYVEIEAMPGTPGVDLYDEDPGGAAALEPAPAAETAPAASAAPPAAQQPAPALEHRPAPPFEPATYTQPQPQPQPQPQAQTQPPAQPQTPAAPAAPELPASTVQRPMLGYAPAASSRPAPSSASAPSGASAPPPFYTREPAAQSSRAGSAYVTAHLAALARADRAKIPPRPRAPERIAEPAPWSADFPEPAPAGMPEPFPAPVRPTPAPQWAAGERREVAPGSQGRARAGVARSLRRCGIGEELTNELIDAAGAHALALAPRAGLAQAVRATLAQRIPVAPPLPSKGAVIVVVGAGGSGKTICCATLLGAYRKSSSLSASFATITRESERGELQLIISPYIMKPSAARAPRALRALGRARGDGIAVIDTPSVSPSDRAGVRELAKLLSELKPERVVVALPATLGATAAAQLLQALKPLGANSLAITHADETDQIGVAVEAACRFGLAPEYMLERARAGAWRLRQVAPSALAERVLP
jgi:flagellar biosynthesis GTPase FlhF